MTEEHDRATPREAVVEVLLQENLGAWAPRDLRASVAAAFAAPGAAANAARLPGVSPVAARSRTWLAAALVLLALGVVFAVAWSRSRVGANTAQDPQPDAADVVPVRDLVHLRELLPQVVRAELEVLRLADADLPDIELAGVPVQATDEWTRGFVAALAADARVQEPAGWDRQNRLSLVLGSGRRIEMSVYTHDRGSRQTLGLRGMQGDLGVGGAGATAVRELLATATHVARLAHGVVVRPQDLDGIDAFPPQQEEMRLFGLAEADLQHLPRYTNLRRLDISGLRHPLGKPALRHIARCRSVEELTVHGVEFDDDQLILLTSLVNLRRWHLRAVRRFTGEGFFTLTNSAFRRVPTELVDLRFVPTLTDRGLRKIAEHGVPELLLGGSGANIGDEGWRALMASPTLRRLDLSGWSLDAGRIRDLAQRTDLVELVLDGCALDDAAMVALARTASPLRRLSVRNVKALTVTGFTALCGIATLREIDLTGVDDLDLDEMSKLAFLHPDVQFVR